MIIQNIFFVLAALALPLSTSAFACGHGYYGNGYGYGGYGYVGVRGCHHGANFYNGNGGCDYSNAANNNGWGWNASAGTSCAPIGISGGIGGCDYSDAGNNNGWGWNASTGTSCPPM